MCGKLKRGGGGSFHCTQVMHVRIMTHVLLWSQSRKCFENMCLFSKMTTRLVKIIFRVILKPTFLSTSHVKCSVCCTLFLSVKTKEKWRATTQPVVLVIRDRALGSDRENLRSRTWDTTTSPRGRWQSRSTMSGGSGREQSSHLCDAKSVLLFF